METFGERLKSIRLLNYVKQREVADYLACTVQCYSNYEKNKTEPNLSNLCSLASFFKITVDELLGFDDSNSFTLDSDVVKIGKKYLRLDSEKKAMLRGYLDALSDNISLFD